MTLHISLPDKQLYSQFFMMFNCFIAFWREVFWKPSGCSCEEKSFPSSHPLWVFSAFTGCLLSSVGLWLGEGHVLGEEIQRIHLNLSMSRRFWLSETKHRVSHPTVTKYIVNENGLVLWRESQFKFFVGSNWHLTSSWMWPLFVQHYSKGLCKVLCL